MQTIGALLERNARSYPKKEFYVFGARRVTYLECYERACRLASGLHQLGMRRQDRFALLGMNSLDFFQVEAAAEVAGFIVGLVNFRLAQPEMEHVIHDMSPKVLVFDEQYAGVIGRLRARLPDVQHYVCLGEAPDWAMSLAQLEQLGAGADLPVQAQPDDVLYLYYTSGTTGRAKGVPWTQRQTWEQALLCARHSEFTGETRVLQVTPAFHMGGKGYPVAAMVAAGTSVLHRAFDPVEFLQTIEREKITFTFMVAAMLQALLEVPNVQSYDLSSIRGICSAAAPIPVPLLRRGIELLGPVFSIQYGMTEVGTVAVMPKHELNPYGSEDDIRRLASVGHVIPDIDCRLLDESGAPCAVGQPGEVVIRAGTQLKGYWNNSVATAEAIRDGWYHTGDMGVLDEEHYLFLVDRKKDMIISGGENIYSREVEEALVRHPEVLEAAVIGVPDTKWGEVVKAIVVLRPGSVLAPAELLAHCKSEIASYKCPKSVEMVGELPRSATGKISKVALREQFRA